MNKISEVKGLEGFVPTLNKMGFMTSTLDPVSQKFVEYTVSQAPSFCLEIGTAYGISTLQALERGAYMVANDLSKAHLRILKQKTSKSSLSRLILRPGSFPEVFEGEKEKFAAVLAARVLHFLEGETLHSFVRKIFELLIPGGKVFIICETPFLKHLGKFLPIYLQRKQENHLWPGLIDNYSDFVESHLAELLPPLINFFDKDVLTRVLQEQGFIIEECEFLNRYDFPEEIRHDGRESVGAIAIKP